MRTHWPLRTRWLGAAGVLAFAALCCTQPALAADRVVLGEGFTATW